MKSWLGDGDIERIFKVTLVLLSVHKIIIVIEGLRHKQILFSENTFIVFFNNRDRLINP